MTAPAALVTGPTAVTATVSCPIPNPAARVRLVCFPHAGGGPAAFRGWAAGLAPDIEVWTVTLAGRATLGQEPFVRDWDTLVRGAADALRPALIGPVALFGHSLGAALAFEVARELTRRGRGPAHLVVSSRTSPEDQQDLRLPPTDEGLVELVESRYGPLSPQLRDEPDLLAVFLPPLRADLELVASYRYRPGPPLVCPVTAISGEADATVPPEGVTGWARFTVGDFEHHRLPGGHFYLADRAEEVLGLLRRRLARAGRTDHATRGSD